MTQRIRRQARAVGPQCGEGGRAPGSDRIACRPCCVIAGQSADPPDPALVPEMPSDRFCRTAAGYWVPATGDRRRGSNLNQNLRRTK